MSKKPSYMPTRAQLNECVDDSGVINLGKIHALCLDLLNEIEAHRAGSGNRTRRSTFRLANRVHAFLTERNFGAAGAPVTRWFWQQPHAEFCIQLCADDCADPSAERDHNRIQQNLGVMFAKQGDAL